MSNDWSQALLLIVIGMGFGLYFAYRWLQNRHQRKQAKMTADYYRGLNFLLNEQPDKALDVFIRLMAVDNETIETHFALGALFRRRGEIDRAIQIHQNLIARPNIDVGERQQALLSLALDYKKAGLFDRAEGLLLKLIDLPAFSEQALNQLAEIYELQGDWQQAISIRERLNQQFDTPQDRWIAHYYCELAESAKDNKARATWLKKALARHKGFPRAHLMLAQQSVAESNASAAMKHLHNAFSHQPDLLVQFFSNLEQCVQVQPKNSLLQKSWESQLLGTRADHVYVGLGALLQTEMKDWTLPYVQAFLQQQNTLQPLIEHLNVSKDPIAQQSMKQLMPIAAAIQTMLKQQANFLCQQCGYAAFEQRWICPSCRQWDQIKPVLEIHPTPKLKQAINA